MDSIQNSNNVPFSPQEVVYPFSPQEVVYPFSPQALVKSPVKDHIYKSVERLGAKFFGECFFAAHELVRRKRNVDVVCPEEFFFSQEGLNGKLNEKQEKARRDFLAAQENLFLDFYRKNMDIFTTDVIVSTLQNMKGDIDEEVLKLSLGTSTVL
jgi:hypothetical protein